MKITLGGFTFHGDDYHGLSGFTVAGISGWTGGAGSRRENSARPGAHGAVRTPSHRPDRMFTYNGQYHGTSLAEVQHMSDALSGLEGLSLPVTVEWGETRWANVEVDRVRFEPEGALPHADYQLELWMPDPFKYGQTREFSTSTNDVVTSHHRGNTEAVPRFRVAGTFPGGYRLHSGGRVVQVSGLATPIVDEIDMVSGRIERDGALNPRLMQIAQFWTVPGGAQLPWAMDRLGGTGTATKFVTDTFI